MKIAIILISFFVFTPAVLQVGKDFPFKKKNRVLIFSLTKGFRHASIADGITAIQKLGNENNFEVDTTKDAGNFTLINLKQYGAVVFLNTTGDVLNDEQQEAFQQYIQSGGGFVGVHSAADTEYDWPWYGRLAGAWFKSHPAVQSAILNVIDTNHPATRHLSKNWQRTDEWYNFKWVSDSLNTLITIDENSYTGNKMGVTHPMSWFHNFDGGRAFYTALGHTKESYTTDPLYLQHLLGGIEYAMGTK